jgi:DNA ligase (NAD+)
VPQHDIFNSEEISLTKKEKARATELENIIPILIKLHGRGEPTNHPLDGHLVPDSEFDGMVKELNKLKPDSNVLKGNLSGDDFDPNAGKVKHDPPMTSINKANGTEEEKKEAFEKWIDLICKELGCTKDEAIGKIVVSYKHDGLAVSLVYKNGELAEAGLRPRGGVWGEDVTLNVAHVKGIPVKLPSDHTLTVRGEIECKISTFEKLNGSVAVNGREFANPRNYATGSIRQFKDPSKTKTRQLSFTAYSILNHDNPDYKTEIERMEWCEKNLGIPFATLTTYEEDTLETMERDLTDLDFEVDGAVLSLNDLEDQDQLGTYGGSVDANTRGKIAWKFIDETADPLVEDIVWQVGRTGQLTPVCTFNGVPLAGTMVRRAAGHSFGFLVRNNIHIGTKVRIRKSGKIIPEILGHYEDGLYIEKIDGGDPNLPKEFDLDKFKYPRICPSCNETTSTVDGQKHGLIELQCTNDDCPARNVRKFLNYLQKFGVKGIGEAIATILVEEGLIKRFCDFYELKISALRGAGRTTRESLLDIARIHMVDAPEKEKDNQILAQRSIDAIQRKKIIPLSKFIAALGIPGASKGTGTALSTQFKDFDEIMAASEDDFKNTPDIGVKTAKNLAAYFVKHNDDIRELISNHVELQLSVQGKYTGKSFVFTGSQVEGKDYWKEIVESEGGVVKSSVSKKTDYVIIGSDPGIKADKAKQLVLEGHSLIIIESSNELKKLLG